MAGEEHEATHTLHMNRTWSTAQLTPNGKVSVECLARNEYTSHHHTLPTSLISSHHTHVTCGWCALYVPQCTLKQSSPLPPTLPPSPHTPIPHTSPSLPYSPCTWLVHAAGPPSDTSLPSPRYPSPSSTQQLGRSAPRRRSSGGGEGQG